MNIACGIISFNPNLNLLKKNIEAIQLQVSDIFVIDNGSNNVNEIESLLQNYRRAHLTKNKENLGIAAALNQACEVSIKKKFQWLLTLDQDSVCPPNFVETLRKVAERYPSVGIVAPLIVDRNVGIVGHRAEGVQKVRTCITSGSLTNLTAWVNIKGFDEKMFIDSVDFDFCYRLRKAGYFIYQTNSVTLNHAIGNSKKCRFLFWEFSNLEHTAFRDFYIAQNNVYYPKKNRMWLCFLRGNLRNLRSIFVVSIYEDDKKNKIKAICRGWKKGLVL